MVLRKEQRSHCCWSRVGRGMKKWREMTRPEEKLEQILKGMGFNSERDGEPLKDRHREVILQCNCYFY